MELDDYLAELTRRLSEVLGDDLLGVYAGGSYALGAYEPGRSDIDVTAVAAVARSHPRRSRRSSTASATRRSPARRAGSSSSSTRSRPRAPAAASPGFELNLNTGADMTFRVDEEPGEIEGFWFAIDRAILREHGVALAGPPPAELFAPIPRAALLPLLRESIDWHRDSDGPARHRRRPQHLPRRCATPPRERGRHKREAGAWAAGGARRGRGARGRGAGPRRRGRALPRRRGDAP